MKKNIGIENDLASWDYYSSCSLAMASPRKKKGEVLPGFGLAAKQGTNFLTH